MNARSRVGALAVSVALALGACGSTPPAPTAATSTSAAPTTTVAAFRPTFASEPCPDDLTTQIVTAATCGVLTVLEDRAKPDGRTIGLFVARFDPPGGTTTPDPVITLGHLASQDGYGGMAGAGQRTHRVLYLLDPRGIGHSSPSLDCPEVAAVAPQVVGLRLRDPARKAIVLGAVGACHDRLVGQGIDLAAYDIAANAADLEDLRSTLGIAQWNINTNGDANRIAFEVARRYPAGLRSLIVDSPSLPTPDFLTVGPAALDLAISRLVAACAGEASCARSFPDLESMIRHAVSKLDADPIAFDVTGTVEAIRLGHAVHVVVDGAAFLRWIRWSLGSGGGAQAAAVPATVRRVLDGALTATGPAVITLASDVGDCVGILTNCELTNFGALYSIVCTDLAGSIDESRLSASSDGRPAYQDVFSPGPLLVPCEAWSVKPVTPPTAGTAGDAVPTLVLRGVFDPFSAPTSDVTKALSAGTSFVLDIPNQSYNTLGYTECPRAIRNAWIDAPTSAPADTSCLPKIPPVRFSAPAG
jgi:pimeloyl-ACP methyl ester carboxylesterase